MMPSDIHDQDDDDRPFDNAHLKPGLQLQSEPATISVPQTLTSFNEVCDKRSGECLYHLFLTSGGSEEGTREWRRVHRDRGDKPPQGRGGHVILHGLQGHHQDQPVLLQEAAAGGEQEVQRLPRPPRQAL